MGQQMGGEAECVTRLRNKRLNAYGEMPNDVSSHYNDEGENEENYYGRFAYELIQNADDAVGKTDEPDNPRKARFELNTGEDPFLLVANTGPAVDAEDTRALTTIGDTTKRDADRKATIGHKGRGFSAVLEITEQPYVFSTDVSFMFDRERSREHIASVIEKLDDWSMADIAGIPLMRLPFAPDHRPSRVEELLTDGYETVFYFPLHEDAVKDVQRSLAELDEQTVLFLHNLKQLEVVTDGTVTAWDVGRHSSSLEAVHSEIDLVEVRRDGDTSATTSYLRFVRDEVSIGDHTAGISNNTWGDVSETRVSVAVRVAKRDDGMHLRPVENEPRVHVFLPTEERSPVPVLINGAFDSNLSRTAIDLSARDLDYNRFLLRKAANILGTDIAAVARVTATTAAEFLSCVDFTTWADPDSRDANTVRDELIRAIQDEFTDVECVPVTEAGEVHQHITPPEALLPSILTAAREPLVDFVEQWGSQRVDIDGDGATNSGYFPSAELLSGTHSDIPPILETLGAESFPVAELPRLLPALPDEWSRIDRYPPGPQRTATDPVVDLVAAVWTHLGEEAQDRFAAVARQQDLVPVAVDDDGSVTRVAAADTELYLPPEGGKPSIDIPGIRFVLEYVYRPRGRLGSKALPQAIEHRQSVIRQVWRPDTFQFEELVRTTVTPRLSNSPEAGRNVDLDMRLLPVLHDLGAETADPAEPLPLQDRYETQPLYRLCQLPVPTKKGWCPAHRVYFGEEWLASDHPPSVAEVFDAADIDAPILIAPDALEDKLVAEGIELPDGLDVESWRGFFRWLGVAPHLRLKSFFAPDEQRRFSDTVDEGGVQRPSNGSSVLGDLANDEWAAYRTHLETALDEMEAGRQANDSIYRVNGFEYWDELRQATREETDKTPVGQALVDHLIAWWEPVFSDHRDAVLATHSVGGFGNRNSSAPSDGEFRKVGTNLWLWQLQTSRWCPTTRGAVSPEEAWDLPSGGTNPFSLGAHSLLPILQRCLDPAVHEAQPLLTELGVRQHLSSDTFTPKDARTVCEGLANVCTSSQVDIADSLREIQPVYRQIQDLAPPVDDPLPEESPWRDATAELGDCEVLCRVDNSFEFKTANKAYFARSPSVRADYPFDNLPFFILEEQRSARLGEYFGLHDFTAAVSVDGEPIDTREVQTEAVRRHLEECAAAILCRLEAERPSQRLIEQDLTRMRSFLDRLAVVDEIKVTYTLDPIGGGDPLETTTTTEYYLQTQYAGSVEERYPYLAYRSHDREQWQLLARTLCAYLDVTQFEGIDALLSAGSSDERRRYLRYANAPASRKALEQKRLQLTEEGSPVSQQFGKPEPVNNGRDTADSPSTGDNSGTEASSGVEQESEDASSSNEQQSRTTQLYDESELRVSNRTISVDPTPAAGVDDSDSAGMGGSEKEVIDTSGDDGDVLNETASNDETRDQSVYDVEDLGMALAEAYEATRLQREFDCETPEAYVFRVDERHLVEAARERHAEAALRILEEEAGIPEHFPGFDLLTVNPDTLEPDRLIELKASTVRRRKPSVSWNEWTTARNEWIQSRESPLYYLYVIGHLSKTTSSEPYIRTIANPFRLLDAQVEHDVSVTQSIQVDIDRFTEEGLKNVSATDPVIEIPVDTTDDGTT
jgi:hypothetical protein